MSDRRDCGPAIHRTQTRSGLYWEPVDIEPTIAEPDLSDRDANIRAALNFMTPAIDDVCGGSNP